MKGAAPHTDGLNLPIAARLMTNQLSIELRIRDKEDVQSATGKLSCGE